ncbi:YopX protein [Vibrio phage H188]|nr:YopX protein [Vibrio phage H188]
MRDIKFRAIDNDGEWCYGLPNYDLDGDIEMSKPDGYTSYGDIDKTLGQYTGLKDKNGVEIYEGDIVDLGQTVNGCNLFVIEWNGFGFIPRYGVEMVVPRAYEYDVSEFYSICPRTGEGLEVIGNIHQKPELLEDKQ